jgi:transposase
MAVIDQAGRLLGTQAFPASTRGYVALVTWAGHFGAAERIGVEGTGTYGAGLARFVHAYGLHVVEVNRPDRSTRRQGKSDPIDAQAIGNDGYVRRQRDRRCVCPRSSC